MKMRKSFIFVKKNLKINIWKINNIVKLQIMLQITILFSVWLCTMQQDHHYQSYQECQVLQNNWEKTSITFGCDQELFHTSLQSYTNHKQISMYMGSSKIAFFDTLSGSYPHQKQSLIANDIFQQFFYIFPGSGT